MIFSLFSPRPWGWTELVDQAGGTVAVFLHFGGDGPAVVRSLGPTIRFPLFGGDEPSSLYCSACLTTFSPLRWGWTADCFRPGSSLGVFLHFGGDGPAVVRSLGPTIRFPHFGGDDPHPEELPDLGILFPHFGGDGPVAEPAFGYQGFVSPLRWGMILGVSTFFRFKIRLFRCILF